MTCSLATGSLDRTSATRPPLFQIGEMSRSKRLKVLEEVNILRALKHPHVVRLFYRSAPSRLPPAPPTLPRKRPVQPAHRANASAVPRMLATKRATCCMSRWNTWMATTWAT